VATETLVKVYPYGMTKEQAEAVKLMVQSVKGQPFSIGQFCQLTGHKAVECEKLFVELHTIGVLRCPDNDGGCNLYQVVPEFVHPAGIKL